MQNEKNSLKIRVGKTDNSKTNGNEVWIYHISSDEISTVDLKKIKKDKNWLTRIDQSAPTGTCLIASENGAELEFEVTGKILNLKCLSHPWSGNIEVLKNNECLLAI